MAESGTSLPEGSRAEENRCGLLRTLAAGEVHLSLDAEVFMCHQLSFPTASAVGIHHFVKEVSGNSKV